MPLREGKSEAKQNHEDEWQNSGLEKSKVCAEMGRRGTNLGDSSRTERTTEND
jgi:hypothetical protein